MRIIVLSDTHGRVKNFERVYRKQPNADLYVHLGDGCDEVNIMRSRYPESAFVTVRGNCDLTSDEPAEKLMTLGGKRIFLTHGHRLAVKSGISGLLAEAREKNADAALFGHTHLPFLEYIDGIYVLNPGSAEFPRKGEPRFGIVDIIKNEVIAHLSDIF